MSLIIWIVLDSESLLASLAEAAFLIGLGENREQRDAGGLEIAWSRFFLSPGAEGRGGRGGLVGGRPAAALGVGGAGVAGEADAGEDPGLGLDRRLRVLSLLPRRRRAAVEGQVVVAVGGSPG